MIRVTHSPEKQRVAAKVLSDALTTAGIKNAFIGGFAMTMLGSSRLTQMSDILIEAGGQDVLALREQIIQMNPHFIQEAFRLYFVEDLERLDPVAALDSRSSRQHILYQGRNNVLIETLRAGALGLPTVAAPLFEDNRLDIPILHPKVLILTKLKRWSQIFYSSRPKTQSKAASDRMDINFLVRRLADDKDTIAFAEYRGKQRDELLGYVRTYWDELILEERQADIALLRTILKPEDLDAIVEAQLREGNSAEAASRNTTPPSQ